MNSPNDSSPPSERLPFGTGRTTRPELNRVLMTVARDMGQRSTCSRKQVGALIVRDGRILSTGYNGAPAGVPHCRHDVDDSTPCNVAVHAEMNAILFAARHGVRVEEAEMFTSLEPCPGCSSAIINAGIARVTYGERYRTHEGIALLEEAQIDVEELR